MDALGIRIPIGFSSDTSAVDRATAALKRADDAADLQTATVHCETGGSKFFETIRAANLAPDAQAAWQASLSYAGASVLESGEEITSITLEPDGVAVAESNEEGSPTAWRDRLRIRLCIDTTAGGGPAVRYASLSSEDLPEPIRDGLLAIYSVLKSLDRAGLVVLGTQPETG